MIGNLEQQQVVVQRDANLDVVLKCVPPKNSVYAKVVPMFVDLYDQADTRSKIGVVRNVYGVLQKAKVRFLTKIQGDDEQEAEDEATSCSTSTTTRGRQQRRDDNNKVYAIVTDEAKILQKIQKSLRTLNRSQKQQGKRNMKQDLTSLVASIQAKIASTQQRAETAPEEPPSKFTEKTSPSVVGADSAGGTDGEALTTTTMTHAPAVEGSVAGTTLSSRELYDMSFTSSSVKNNTNSKHQHSPDTYDASLLKESDCSLMGAVSARPAPGTSGPGKSIAMPSNEALMEDKPLGSHQGIEVNASLDDSSWHFPNLDTSRDDPIWRDTGAPNPLLDAAVAQVADARGEEEEAGMRLLPDPVMAMGDVFPGAQQQERVAHGGTEEQQAVDDHGQKVAYILQRLNDLEQWATDQEELHEYLIQRLRTQRLENLQLHQQIAMYTEMDDNDYLAAAAQTAGAASYAQPAPAFN